MAWVEVVGWAGSVLLIVSLLQTRLLRLRVLNTVAAAVLVLYNSVINVWPMVAMNIAIIGINLVQIARLRSAGKPNGYTLLEVDPQDEYLRHLLRVYEADIREFYPGFVFDPAAPHTGVFLILREDEAAGVVLLSDSHDPTVARLELDYVTPKYRDFSPGEYVFDHSGWFADRGYDTVIAPGGLRPDDPYLRRMGFQRRGEEWVRQV